MKVNIMTVQLFVSTKPRKLPVRWPARRHRYLKWLYIGHSSPGMKWECVISWGCRSLYLWVVASCHSCLHPSQWSFRASQYYQHVNTICQYGNSLSLWVAPPCDTCRNSQSCLLFIWMLLCFLSSFHREVGKGKCSEGFLYEFTLTLVCFIMP